MITNSIAILLLLSIIHPEKYTTKLAAINLLLSHFKYYKCTIAQLLLMVWLHFINGIANWVFWHLSSLAFIVWRFSLPFVEGAAADFLAPRQKKKKNPVSKQILFWISSETGDEERDQLEIGKSLFQMVDSCHICTISKQKETVIQRTSRNEWWLFVEKYSQKFQSAVGSFVCYRKPLSWTIPFLRSGLLFRGLNNAICLISLLRKLSCNSNSGKHVVQQDTRL